MYSLLLLSTKCFSLYKKAAFMLQNDALEPVIWAFSWRETGFIAVRVNITLDLKYGKTFIIRYLYML